MLDALAQHVNGAAPGYLSLADGPRTCAGSGRLRPGLATRRDLLSGLEEGGDLGEV